MGKIEAKLRKSMLKEVNNACETKMDELNTKVIEKIEKVENALDNKFDILLQKITEVSQNSSPKEEVNYLASVAHAVTQAFGGWN